MHYGSFFLEEKGVKSTLRHKMSTHSFVITFFVIAKLQICYMASIAACHYKKISVILSTKKLFLEFFYRYFSMHLVTNMNKT